MALGLPPAGRLARMHSFESNVIEFPGSPTVIEPPAAVKAASMSSIVVSLPSQALPPALPQKPWVNVQ
jgi:hypothetical protein